MYLNADFAARAAVHAARLDWVGSPIAGVERRMLDRVGGEIARATSIVRYAPGSRFAAHIHGGGEEFLVLEGVFQDEHGDFPAGSYVRNPPQSRHMPGSESGCVIFVKLWQFAPDDRKQVFVDTDKMAWQPAVGRPGVDLLPLFRNSVEDVRMERWTRGTEIELAVPGGIELLVLNGGFHEDDGWFSRLSWLRLPPGDVLMARAGDEGCRLWVKSGHLFGDVVAEFLKRVG